MKRQFTCELYAPSLKRSIRFNEININCLQNIVKYIQNQDDTGLCDYFTDLLEYLCPENSPLLLDRVDKFCILLGLRIICIGPIFEMQFDCKKTNQKFNYKLDLINILQKISNLDLYGNNLIKVDENITVCLGFPPKLAYESHEDVIFSCLSHVIIKNESFNMTSMDEDQRNSILSLLPGTISSDIYDFIFAKQKMLNDVVFMDVRSPFDPDDTPITMKLDSINNTFMEILKGIFKMNLNDLYDLIYIMVTKLKFNGSYIENNMTFAEATVYLNKYTEELKEREKAMQKQQSGQSAPAGNPLPMNVPYTGIE
jgi:hypothetical protein